MLKEDQEARRAFIDSGMQDKELDRAGVGVDQRNTARLKEIIEEYGWPTRGLVGDDGAGAAFLLVQHADLDLPFQERCLQLMEEIAAEGGEQVHLASIAYLTDRICMAKQEEQVYGTQVLFAANPADRGSTGVVLYPVKDPDTLEERREAYGLPPMEEYLKMVKKQYHIEE